jgi:hypothetical protein
MAFIFNQTGEDSLDACAGSLLGELVIYGAPAHLLSTAPHSYRGVDWRQPFLLQNLTGTA